MFGETLAVGYFNNEAYSATLAGAVTILHGSASGLTASGSQQWHQNIAGFPDEAETLDIFGAALAVGDFDHNGQDDLAIGVPGEMVAPR